MWALLFAVALSTFVPSAALAVCENADIVLYNGHIDDDARGARGLLAKIDCLKKESQTGVPADRKAAQEALAPLEQELAMRKQLWEWEGAGPPNYDPTVVCDGKGGMRPALFGHGGEWDPEYPKCLYLHEQQHIKDFRAICPNWCKGKTSGTIGPYLDSRMPAALQTYMKGLCPAWKSARDYKYWRFKSECDAYNIQVQCTLDLIERKKPASNPSLRSVLKVGKAGHAENRQLAASMNPPGTCEPLPDGRPTASAAKAPMTLASLCWQVCVSHFINPKDSISECTGTCGADGVPPELSATEKSATSDEPDSKKVALPAASSGLVPQPPSKTKL